MRSAFISLPYLVVAALGVLAVVALPSIEKIGRAVKSIRFKARANDSALKKRNHGRT